MNPSANYNPDVLLCLANLSSDEVFTPPNLANEVLDLLPAEIWRDPSATFLDPACKSGVFLREIARRLDEGLQDRIPDRQARIDHIMTRQVFGIAITELTALTARRSLYCSKIANGPYSVCTRFDNEQGNIRFDRINHTWQKGNCVYCGASEAAYARDESLETHAYAFLHTDNPKELFDMEFDVIISNPPYQLSDGGAGASAVPIYHRFIDAGRLLRPRYLSMIVPSRWLFGGRGLDDFRSSLLSDQRIRQLVDYSDSREVFPGVDVAGGICYFLWDRDNKGQCLVTEKGGFMHSQTVERPLLEDGMDVFIRQDRAISLLRKMVEVEGGSGVRLPKNRQFAGQVSGQKPFGLRTYFRGEAQASDLRPILVLQSGGKGWTSLDNIPTGHELIDQYKVFTSKSSAEHAGQVDKKGQRMVLSLTGILPPNSVVTETYILLGSFASEYEAQSCYSYVRTKLFRYLIATRSSAQDISRAAYEFVPVQSWDQEWTDEKLYAKYGLTDDEIAHIEATIRQMPPNDDLR